MLFNSTEFMIFFPITLILYWIFPKKYRYICLFIASYTFYMFWNPKYALLMGTSTVVTFLSGVLIEKLEYKRTVVAFSFIINLAILIFFKYFDFLLQNINIVLSALNIQLINKPFDVILPVGISFYTFQALSYTIDVYRGEIKSEKNIIKYALFVSFFPQLVAGPIERSKNLLIQIENLEKVKRFDYDRITEGFTLMLFGYFQKMVIADRAAILVDTVFNGYYEYNSMALILSAVFFAVQIYCDFGSYSLIAIGTAKVMGINLMENFNTPYFSRSVKEFWGRWHISLSTWFRDYLYIPLGGNRCSNIRKSFNILVTFLVSGLWHGANFTFIAWGAIHGIFHIIEEQLKPIKEKYLNKFKIKTNAFSFALIEIIITFIIVDLAWIFFRAETIHDAIHYIQRIFTRIDLWTLFDGTLYGLGLNIFEMNILIIALFILISFDLVKYIRKESIFEFLNKQNLYFRWFVMLFLIFYIIVYGKYGAGFDPKQFIYFQF
ncbi:MBOAT family O-acyltransferase [Brachyspira murdochii]|uniref:Membrane bound O-acyl transferase MBOAT family protein n=1 Tax=Brachyspira murdochii (strain ATCC 51284 / DSM 12563 / 56-150) TaxID=526224 RepID=D5U465_BRAM5|nr:MBOAT family O-acyltransferase [Brachyspira murdochii]ADG72246.1 membrane bound O-acyl transferase MBOAT family protein [Brachyspira murdochii DSM 12563]